MLLHENEFKKHISSGDYDNIYFIYGNEKMIIKNMTNSLVNKLTDNEKNEFNYHEFDSDSDLSDISVSVCIVPFLAGENVVVVKDMDFEAMSSDDIDVIMKILDDVPNSTRLIFTMPTLDKESGKNFKKVQNYITKNGVCVEISHREELGIEKIICRWARQGGSEISELTANRLIKYVGSDLNSLHREVEKLVAYADGQEITPEMIEKLVSENLDARVFDLFTFVVTKNSDKAMKTLDILFYQQEEPVAICIILGNSYVDAYRARVAYESGVPLSEVAEKFDYKKRAWALDKTQKQVRNITTDSLRDSIGEIVNTQLKMVSVSVNNNVELEKLVAKLIVLANRK